jgi:hypothetical protein
MIPYLARLLDITINNNAIPGDWKKGIVVSIYRVAEKSPYTQTIRTSDSI